MVSNMWQTKKSQSSFQLHAIVFLSDGDDKNRQSKGRICRRQHNSRNVKTEMKLKHEKCKTQNVNRKLIQIKSIKAIKKMTSHEGRLLRSELVKKKSVIPGPRGPDRESSVTLKDNEITVFTYDNSTCAFCKGVHPTQNKNPTLTNSNWKMWQWNITFIFWCFKTSCLLL